MVKEDIIRIVKSEILQRVGICDVELSHSLKNDLGFDSLDIVEIALDVEKALDKAVSIQMEDVDSWETVEDIVNTFCGELKIA